MSMTREEALELVGAMVLRDRAATHGDAENVFAKIAEMWTAYLGHDLARDITDFDAAMMMALLKIARASENPAHLDNALDLAGYGICAASLVRGEE